MSKYVYQLIIHDEHTDIVKSPLFSSKHKTYMYLNDFISKQDIILEQIELNNGTGYLMDIHTDITCYGYNIQMFEVF